MNQPLNELVVKARHQIIRCDADNLRLDMERTLGLDVLQTIGPVKFDASGRSGPAMLFTQEQRHFWVKRDTGMVFSLFVVRNDGEDELLLKFDRDSRDRFLDALGKALENG